jgi:shikimate kinase
MMGSGKSAIGRALAALTGRDFQDTDILLQNRFGRSVSQIFQIYGEEAFRGHETSVLKGLQPCNCVLATGGGIVMRAENWAELRRIGVVIFLKASAQTLIERLEQSKKKRPLLSDAEWRDRATAILHARMPLYEQADVVVEVDGLEISEATQRVLEALQTHAH